MNIEDRYTLNRDGFLQAAHIALLYRMLAAVGYRHGTPEFDQLRRAATKEQVEEDMRQYLAFTQNNSWLPHDQPLTAMGAIIEDSSIPPNEIQYRDKATGRILGRIVDMPDET